MIGGAIGTAQTEMIQKNTAHMNLITVTWRLITVSRKLMIVMKKPMTARIAVIMTVREGVLPVRILMQLIHIQIPVTVLNIAAIAMAQAATATRRNPINATATQKNLINATAIQKNPINVMLM